MMTPAAAETRSAIALAGNVIPFRRRIGPPLMRARGSVGESEITLLNVLLMRYMTERTGRMLPRPVPVLSMPALSPVVPPQPAGALARAFDEADGVVSLAAWRQRRAAGVACPGGGFGDAA